tara:strand:+ start:1621 stop:2580 length:960 start_codon:yes stop_codon:yes gene_type:complete
MVRVYRKDFLEGYEVSDDEAKELAKVGYTTKYAEAQAASFSAGGQNFGGDAESGRTVSEGKDLAKAMYSFLPPKVIEQFAKNWVKSGDPNIALGATRQTKEWKDNYGYLEREDGSLIMDELSAESTIATYKQTLGEVGIQDYTDFEDDFKEMITGEVSGAEFQQRVDVVYSGVVNQIPEVETLFRERYNINVDQPTIFASLINPKIQDKVLAGEIATIQLQAEAASRGFSTSFARFQELKNLGLTQQQARSLYETAGTVMQQATTIGRDLELETLEEAALGDVEAQKRIQRVQAELQSKQGITLGAAKKGDEITGLIAD